METVEADIATYHEDRKARKRARRAERQASSRTAATFKTEDGSQRNVLNGSKQGAATSSHHGKSKSRSGSSRKLNGTSSRRQNSDGASPGDVVRRHKELDRQRSRDGMRNHREEPYQDRPEFYRHS